MRLYFTVMALAAAIAAWPQAGNTPDYFADGKEAILAKNYTQAIEHFKKAVEQKPQDGEAWYELGWCYNELAKYEDAIKAFEKAKTWWKDVAKVYYESGYANDYIGKTNNAIEDYKKCIAISESYASAYRQLGNIYFDINKDYKTALYYYNKYTNYSAGKDITARVWYKKGYSEIELEQYDNALASLKKALVIDIKYSFAYNELGYVYYKQGKADDAIVAYMSSRQLDSTNSTPCSGLGDVNRYLKKNTDEALTWYKKGAVINPKSQNCQYGTGWCYNEKGMHREAIPYLKKAVEINNSYTAAYTELGYAYYSLKRYDDALAELDRSVKLSETGVAIYYKGLCYIGKNQKPDAQEMYRKLVDMKSADAPTLLKRINAM